MAPRSVLVTGASTGIGEACALLLAERGWRVFAGVRRDEDGRRLAGEARGDLEPVLLDVTDEAGVEKVVGSIGELAGLVNNAGIALGGPVEYIPLEDWRRQFEVNVIGQVSVTRRAIPLLRGGRIVFIGSVSGRISTPLVAPYGASKHAIEAIAESLRHELRPAGIMTVVVEPGAVRTPIWDKGRRHADEIEASLPAEALTRYAPAIAAVRKGIDLQERSGIPPRRVAEVVERALTSPRPRARYLVGRDAVVQGAIDRFLPDSARDLVVRAFTRP